MKTKLKFVALSFLAISFILPGSSIFAQEPETGIPEMVKNVTATPDAQKVNLAWEESLDEDGVVVGYKIYYGTRNITTKEDAEDEILVPVQTAHTVTDLSNDIDYYFSVVAIDDEENESPLSAVVTAVPMTDSPAVTSVEQTSNSEVVITFSKVVQLKGGPKSFLFEEEGSGREITISTANVEGERVILTIPDDSLDIDRVYRVTATSLVEDTSGVPVRSGITDTAKFTAKFFEPPAPPEVVAEPEPEPTPEPAVETPPEEEVLSVAPPEELTDVLSPDYWEEETYDVAPKDETPPLDASNLSVDSNLLRTENIVLITWEPALDIENDIADQILFTKMGLGTWDDGISVGKYTDEIELDVEINQNYQVKVVTVDQAENRSNGVTLTFSTHLTQSGPGGTVIALLIAIFLGVLFFSSSRNTV